MSIDTNPFETSLTVVGHEATDKQRKAARGACARHADNPGELVELLDMLGILEDVA